MVERGVSDEEIEQVVANGSLSEARAPRSGRELVFSEGYTRSGRHYPRKRVKVIYLREGDDVVVVTVLSYYGRWEATT